MCKKAHYVTEVNVIDPYTGYPVEISVYKDEASGGMFAVDSSYLLTLSEDDPVIEPFNGDKVQLIDESSWTSKLCKCSESETTYSDGEKVICSWCDKLTPEQEPGGIHSSMQLETLDRDELEAVAKDVCPTEDWYDLSDDISATSDEELRNFILVNTLGKIPEEEHLILFFTYAVLSTRWPEAMDLLNKMVARCEQNVDYKAYFLRWLREGSTLSLRELASPFGEYIVCGTELDFQNAVNAIDTSKFHAELILDPSNESGELNPDYEDTQFGKVYNIRRVDISGAKNTIHWCMSTPL